MNMVSMQQRKICGEALRKTVAAFNPYEISTASINVNFTYGFANYVTA